MLYPGLPSHPDHALAQRLMSGFGGMLGLELKDAARVADRLSFFALTLALA